MWKAGACSALAPCAMLLVDAREALTLFEQEIRDQIAAADFTGAQAKTAGRMLTETIAVANESGISGLCDRMHKQVNEFAALRRRRPEHNDPVTLVVGLVLIGLGAATVAACIALSGGRLAPTVPGAGGYAHAQLGRTRSVSERP